MTKTNFKATILWGKDAIIEYEQNKLGNLSDHISTAEFDTEAELKAYFKGIDDMSGWLDYRVISK